MGHPAAPLTLLLLLCPAAPSSPCFTFPPDAPTELDLTNRSHQCSQLDWGVFQRQTRLHLSRNGIEALSPSSRIEPGLVELDLSHNRLQELPDAFLSRARQLWRLQLQHNQLRELPDGFFANATALRSLSLEGNPLRAVPATAFQAHLSSLDVSCRCDVVSTVLAPCSCSPPDCNAPRCRCLTSHQTYINVTDFHAQECWGNVGLVASLAAAASGVAVGLVVAAVVCYRWRKADTDISVGWDKQEPTTTYGQPHYISRAAEIGTGDATNTAPDYENVFVSPCTAPARAQGWTPGWREEQDSPQAPVDDNYFLESEDAAGDQPIYANMQHRGDDNLYIVPDH